MEPDSTITPFEQLNWYANRVIARMVSDGAISPHDRTQALERLLGFEEDSYESFSVPDSAVNPYPYFAADRTLIKAGLLKTRLVTDLERRFRFERYPTHEGIRALINGSLDS